MLARWRRPTSPTMDQAMTKWQLKVNLEQTSIIWEEGISGGLSMLGYPVGMSVRDYLKSLMWEDSAYCGHHHSLPRKGLLNCIRVITLSASKWMIIHFSPLLTVDVTRPAVWSSHLGSLQWRPGTWRDKVKLIPLFPKLLFVSVFLPQW